MQALQNQLQSLTPEQQTVIQAHDLLSQQAQWLQRTTDLPEKVAQLLEQVRNQINSLGSITIPPQLPNAVEVQKLVDDSNNFTKRILEQLQAAATEAKGDSWMTGSNKEALAGLRKAFTDHQAEYEKCVKESSKNQKQLDEIQTLNKQVGEHETRQASLESERNTLKVLFDEVGTAHWDSFLRTLEERADLLRRQCEIISGQAQHEFKASLAFCADERSVRAAIERLVQGRNVKDSEQKIKALSTLVCGDDHHPRPP